MVEYRPTTRITSAVPDPYQIIQRGPTEDGEFKYRIKSPRASLTSALPRKVT